jgi:hypothetical protein
MGQADLINGNPYLLDVKPLPHDFSPLAGLLSLPRNNSSLRRFPMVLHGT